MTLGFGSILVILKMKSLLLHEANKFYVHIWLVHNNSSFTHNFQKPQITHYNSAPIFTGELASMLFTNNMNRF